MYMVRNIGDVTNAPPPVAPPTTVEGPALVVVALGSVALGVALTLAWRKWGPR